MREDREIVFFLREYGALLVGMCLALMGGSFYGAYQLIEESISINEIRQYFMNVPATIDGYTCGIIFWSQGRILFFIWLISSTDTLKKLNIFFVMGYIFAYGYTMTLVMASISLKEGTKYMFPLVIEGILMISYMLVCCKQSFQEQKGISRERNLWEGLKGIGVCVLVTAANLISYL